MKKTRRKQSPYTKSPTTGRAMIVVRVDDVSEVRRAQHWLAEHRAALTFISEDEGCGCCVNIWRVAGPAAIIATLPPSVSASCSWVDTGA